MIKMRINKEKEIRCTSCNELSENVPEMYDIAIGNEIVHVCKYCSQTLFQKILKADCLYNSRLKSQDDISRINRANKRKFEKRNK